jgi:hypothetical protein
METERMGENPNRSVSGFLGRELSDEETLNYPTRMPYGGTDHAAL